MKIIPRQASRLVLLISCLMYFVFYIDRVNISTAAPIMQKDLGLTATELGVAFSAFAYPYAFFQIAGGWLGRTELDLPLDEPVLISPQTGKISRRRSGRG